MKIDFSVNQQSGPKIPVSFWQKSCKKIEKNIKIKSKVEVSIAVIGSDKIRTLNRMYRKKDKPTDVLSFEAVKDFRGRDYLGEVIICYPKALSQAKKRGVNVLAEIEFLLVHGFLHLIGFDHQNLAEEKKMDVLQEKIIKTKI